MARCPRRFVFAHRRDLLRDVERRLVGGLVVSSLDCLGSSPGEIEAIPFELKMEGIEVVAVREA